MLANTDAIQMLQNISEITIPKITTNKN
ncbi:protein of unknown function [Cupriavidus taiwanensis]|nr:protein of unknown function [Cupriavidus taiwanensis]